MDEVGPGMAKGPPADASPEYTIYNKHQDDAGKDLRRSKKGGGQAWDVKYVPKTRGNSGFRGEG